MFCENCGKELKENAKFCDECGAKVTIVPPSAVPSEPEVQENVYTQNTSQPEAQQPQQGWQDQSAVQDSPQPQQGWQDQSQSGGFGAFQEGQQPQQGWQDPNAGQGGPQPQQNWQNQNAPQESGDLKEQFMTILGLGNPVSGMSIGALVLTLLCCGGGDAMAKVFQQLGARREDALYFFWLFTTAALLSAVLAALEHRRTGRRMLPGEFAAGLLAGIPNYFSSYLLLLALERVPSFVAYPLYSTGTIVLVTAVSAACFGEKPGRRQAAGLVLILAALALLSLG